MKFASMLRLFFLGLILIFSGWGCENSFKTDSSPAVVASSVVSAGLLKDINSGVSQNISSTWIKMGTALYFINNPAINPGHQIWKASATGTASLVKDLGYEGYVTSLVVDNRSSVTPSRFYFVVNGTQLWTSDGTTTSMIAEYDDGNGIISTKAMGNDLYFQVNGTGNNGKVYKSVAGATPGEIYTTGTTSFAANVTFVPSTTVMYIYLTAANSTMYSHSGAPGACTTVRALTAANTVTQAKTVGADIYFQESASFRVFKSVAGAAAGEIMTDLGASVASAVTTVAASTHMYIYLNAANSKMFSHSGAAGNADLIDTTPAANTVTMAKTVGDDLYYQYSASFKVMKSVAGAAAAEVTDNAAASFAAAVTTVAGSTLMYIYHTAANAKVFAHSGAAGAADLVATVTAANTVSNPTVVTDDLYYQESATFKVMKSEAGGSAAEITDHNSDSFTAAVAFKGGSVDMMYWHGNASGGNAKVYSHSGVAGDATEVMNGTTGLFNSNKMITVGDNLFFEGPATSPVGLFISIDGAASAIVGDFSPSANDDSLCTTPYTPTPIGSYLFFVANNGTNGCELWVTGGTTAGTSLVDDVNAGQVSAHPKSLTAVGTRIYFVARDSSVTVSPNNYYLFYSDSPYTSASKVTLTGADANPSPVYLTAVGTKLYFGASVGGVVTLFSHDASGTAAAGIKQTSVGPANLIMNAGTEPFIVPLGTKAIIRAAPAGGAIYDIYSSDSTAAISENPSLVKHIHSNAGTSSDPTLFSKAYTSTTVFFSADDGTGPELWKTDGTTVGTTRIRNVSSDGSGVSAALPQQLTLVGTDLYFTATDTMPGEVGQELFVSSYPWTNAKKLTYTTGFDPVIQNLFAVGTSKLIFTMADESNNSVSLYVTDGTVAGTTRLLRGVTGGVGPLFNSAGRAYVNSTHYFVYKGNLNYVDQLYKSNGTLSGTGLVKAINPAPDSNGPDEVAQTDRDNFSVVGNSLIFPANNGASGTQLWYSDSVTGATEMISNFTPNDNDGAAPTYLGTAGGAAYYILRDSTHGRSLYKVY